MPSFYKKKNNNNFLVKRRNWTTGKNHTELNRPEKLSKLHPILIPQAPGTRVLGFYKRPRFRSCRKAGPQERIRPTLSIRGKQSILDPDATHPRDGGPRFLQVKKPGFRSSRRVGPQQEIRPVLSRPEERCKLDLVLMPQLPGTGISSVYMFPQENPGFRSSR